VPSGAPVPQVYASLSAYGGMPEVEPSFMGFSGGGPSDIVDLAWSSWGAQSALGTGLETNGAGPVNVILSNPVRTSHGTVFSLFTQDGAGKPSPYFEQWQLYPIQGDQGTRVGFTPYPDLTLTQVDQANLAALNASQGS
jgi:hypothetical protein